MWFSTASTSNSSYFSFQKKKTNFPVSFSFCSPKLPLYYHPKSCQYDPKQQEFKIQTNKVPWLILVLTILFILFISNHILSLPPFEKTRGVKPYVPGEVRILVGCKQWKEEHNLSSKDLCMYWTRTIFDNCCSLVVCIKRWMNLDPVLNPTGSKIREKSAKQSTLQVFC